MIKNFSQLGFSANEAKVYLALLNIGESPSGQIIKKTGLHRNIVYESLDSLVKKKLVKETVKSGKKYFAVRDPQILIDKVQENLDLTNKIVKQIRQGLKTTAPEVIVYEGQEGWQTAYRRMMKRIKPKDSVFTLGAGGDKWIAALGDLFVSHEKFMEENNITLKMIAYEWQRQEISARQSHIFRITKYLPRDYSMPANTEIFKDRIFIQIYTDPIILIEIISREVAAGYRQHFETLWEVAKD